MKHSKVDKFVDNESWLSYIGKSIKKRSGKPFKSGIPDKIEVNPQSGNIAFHMIADDTLVDCHQCKLS